MTTQLALFEQEGAVATKQSCVVKPLLKWIGSKHRFAPKILEFFPIKYNCYIEPFLGSGAVLGALSPHTGLAADTLAPLIGIWKALVTNPYALIRHYEHLWQKYVKQPNLTYTETLCRFNKNPNPFDLLFLCRTCYGGIVRFTRQGTMSTPLGPHRAISPEQLSERIFVWRERIKNTTFIEADFRETMRMAKSNDIIYCDPPYTYSQSILYGAQSFHLDDLWEAIDRCVSIDAKVVLSIDGRKKSGTVELNVDIPKGLFQREITIDCGYSMVRRFQKRGARMEGERVQDRLLLTW